MAENASPIDVESALLQLDFRLNTPKHYQCNITQEIEQYLLSTGKRVRPLLTLMVAKSLNAPLSPNLVLARASELVHAASLAHDDVIDGAKIRRGKPTLNSIQSDKMAVMAGDFLLSRVVREVSELNSPSLLQALAKTVEELSCGEWRQEQLQKRLDVSHQEIREIFALKTGALLAWCCIAPGLTISLNPETLEKLRDAGIEMGIAFQLIDDILDFETTSEKPFAQDLINRVLNSVSVEWIQRSPKIRDSLATHFEGSINSSISLPLDDWAADPQLIIAKEKIRDEARERLERSRNLLQSVFSETSRHETATWVAEMVQFDALFSFICQRTL